MDKNDLLRRGIMAAVRDLTTEAEAVGGRDVTNLRSIANGLRLLLAQTTDGTAEAAAMIPGDHTVRAINSNRVIIWHDEQGRRTLFADDPETLRAINYDPRDIPRFGSPWCFVKPGPFNDLAADDPVVLELKKQNELQRKEAGNGPTTG